MVIISYIDPGAGSLVIQAIIAAVVSVPFIFRSAIRRGLDRFRQAGPTAESTSEESVEPQ